MDNKSDDAILLFQGRTVIHGDVVYQKIVHESDGTWEHRIFYISFVGKDGKTPRVWEQPYPGTRKALWLSVQPMVIEFINAKCADGWELVSDLSDYDDILDFTAGTDLIRWIAEFVLSLGTGGLTNINAYWTEARGARLHFRRKVLPAGV